MLLGKTTKDADHGRGKIGVEKIGEVVKRERNETPTENWGAPLIIGVPSNKKKFYNQVHGKKRRQLGGAKNAASQQKAPSKKKLRTTTLIS